MIPYQTSIASVHSSAIAPLSKMATGDFSPPKPRGSTNRRRVTTLYLENVLYPEYLSDFRAKLFDAIRDDSIEQVVILANSPGGFCEGCEETAEVVRRLAAKKTATVVAEGYLCSAAFHVASGATKIIASPSTIVGSCGVVCVLVDDSAAYREAGLKVIPICTAPAKQRGLPGVEVTENDIEAVKKSIEESRRMFQKSLRLGGRMTSRQREDAFESGEAYHAAEAKKRGYIDEVALVEDAIEAIFDRQPETFEHLHGAEAVEKFNSLLCKYAKVDEYWDAPDSAVERFEKKYPELAANVEFTISRYKS